MKVLKNAIFNWSNCRLESADIFDYVGPVALCGGKGGRPPPAPDPYAVADATTKTNQAGATYNNAITHGNTYTPLGAQTYTSHKDPVTGATVYDQNVLLAPDQQKLLDQQNQQNLALGDTAQGMLSQVQNSYRNPLDLSGAPALQSGGPLQTDITGGQDLTAQRQAAVDALYKQQSQYLDPQFQQAQTALHSRLANQGITQGSEAWNNATNQFADQQQKAYADARNSAIAGGASEQALASQIAGQQGQFHNAAITQQANTSNAARNQALQEAFATRNQPLNEFNALRTASPVSLPQFSNAQTATANPADIAGNIWNSYNGQLNAYNTQQQGNNSLMGGLFGLGSAAILNSDVRLKTDIHPVGTIGNGMGVYDFAYKDEPDVKYTGLMAQEVEKVIPEAVGHDKSGYKTVDYRKVLAKVVGER